MAATSEVLQVGDTVRIKDMPTSEMNGKVGTLAKAVGSGRWSVRIESLGENSRVVSVRNIEKVERFDPETLEFHVVGTWDDWEPRAMTWDPASERYEFSVVLGAAGQESFRILRAEDWDFCIYPSQSDANIHDGFKLLGPNDCQDCGEWTIGKHEADLAAPDACYKIILLVEADGSPSKVAWEPVSGQRVPKANKKPVPRVQKDDVADGYPAPKEASEPRRGDGYGGYRQAVTYEDEDQALPTVGRSFGDEDRADRGQARKGLFSAWQSDVREESCRLKEKDREAKLLEEEKAARIRLEKRLEAAQAAEKLQIEDGEDGHGEVRGGAISTFYANQDDVQERLQRNRERMDELEGLEAGTKAAYDRLSEKMPHLAGALQQQLKLGGKVPAPQKPRMKQGICVECGEDKQVLTNGSCEICWVTWQNLNRAGWNPNAQCDGASAGMRTMELCEANPRISKLEARRKVMSMFPTAFKARV